MLSLAREFGSDIQIESSLSKQKLLLQKCVLDNIIKEDQSDYFRRLLKETEQMFSFQKRPGFSCCLAGCLFYADRHKSYIKHLQQVHSTYHRFSCQFRHKCYREFSLIGLLIEHIKESHSGSITTQGSYVSFPDINIACKCDMMSCGGKKFSSPKQLMTHINTDHVKKLRQCFFEDCSTQFKANSTSRTFGS